MKTYLFTSTNFDGEILFQFNQEGNLLKYDTTGAQLNTQQLEWITTRLPRTLDQLKMVLKASKGGQLVEQKQTGITFLMFWDAYNQKARSSKKKAERTWNRLSQTQRDKAFNYIPIYYRNIPDGIAAKYAETYLNAELWNN